MMSLIFIVVNIMTIIVIIIIVIMMIQAFLSYDCEGALLTDSLTGQVVAGDGDVYLLRSLSSSS